MKFPQQNTSKFDKKRRKESAEFMIYTYLYGFAYVVSNQKYRWIPCHRRYTSIFWNRCGISCVDSITFGGWRFWNRVDIGIWWDPTLDEQVATFRSSLALLRLDHLRGDFWCHGRHWSIRLEHQVEYQAIKKEKYEKKLLLSHYM